MIFKELVKEAAETKKCFHCGGDVVIINFKMPGNLTEKGFRCLACEFTVSESGSQFLPPLLGECYLPKWIKEFYD